MDKTEYRMMLLSHGLRQSDVAKKVGVSQQMLNRQIRLDVLKTKTVTAIVQATGMSRDEFIDIFYPKINL